MIQRQTEASEPAFWPVSVELIPAPDPVRLFRRMAGLPHCLFLDSAAQDGERGRYSFLAADPYDFLCVPPDGSDALAEVERRLGTLMTSRRDDLPPFQGGLAGLFSYDLNQSLERLPAPRQDEFQVPALAVGWYDVVIAFDHLQGQAWIISQGLPETTHSRRLARAKQRLREFETRLQRDTFSQLASAVRSPAPLLFQQLAPQYATSADPQLTSNFPPGAYQQTIERVIEYIRAGDVFQVNLSQRLLFPAERAPIDLYLRLREHNPAPFAAYFDMGGYQIISASPERFLSVRERMVETRPIKGTRQRYHLPEADLFSGSELLASEKDRAENIMIVDLLRNDISRVCRPDSVRVTELCRLETYQYVQHLVSVVVGELAAERTSLDLIRATFPGGSITGAPKVRAMEIIQQLEPTARGAYCGSLGYVSLDGTMDLSILIRTITAGRGWWQFPVGGGIVAQSDPQREYEETWHKAVGLLRALRR